MKLKSKSVTLILVLVCGGSYAQDSIMSSRLSSLWFHPYSGVEFDALTGINASALAESPMFNGALVTDILRGRIDDQTKTSMFHGLGNSIRTGIGHQLDVTYINFDYLIKNMDHTYGFVNLSDQSLIELQFNPDVAEMGLRGNAPFSGQTIASDPFNMRSLHFQKAGIGVIHFSQQREQNRKWYVQLSAVGGRNYNRVGLTESQLYTSSSGDSVLFSLSGFQNGIPAHRDQYYNGAGVSLDAGWLTASDDFYFSAQVSNMGTVRWGSFTEQLTFDSSVVFEGLQWVDEESRFGFPSYLGDSARHVLSSAYSNGALWESLPFDIQLKTGKRFKNQIISVGIIYRHGWFFLPAAELSHEWVLRPNLRLVNNLFILGYGRYQWFSQIDWAFAKRFQIQMGVGGLQMLWGHKGGGQLNLGLNVSL